MSGPNFSGTTAEYYLRFRRGYPGLVIDRLVQVLGLDADSRVLDLGCGSGQLTLPLARRVAVVIGADPEIDMLKLGRQAGLAEGIENVVWLLAADSDLGALNTLLGDGTLAAVTIGCAFHWMDCPSLLARTRKLLQPGGLVAFVTNGLPDWEHDTRWAQILREKLQAELGRPASGRTGTDADRQRTLVSTIEAAGFTGLTETVVEYPEERTVEELIGSLYSAMSPGGIRRLRSGGFEAELAEALADVAIEGRLAAQVQVRILSAAHA